MPVTDVTDVTDVTGVTNGEELFHLALPCLLLALLALALLVEEFRPRLEGKTELSRIGLARQPVSCVRLDPNVAVCGWLCKPSSFTISPEIWYMPGDCRSFHQDCKPAEMGSKVGNLLLPSGCQSLRCGNPVYAGRLSKFSPGRKPH